MSLWNGHYAIRLPANRILQERMGYLLTRPVGGPPNEMRRSYANFSCEAGSWAKPAQGRGRGRVALIRASVSS
jgi:hypothetical protein